ncbi:MAG: hypothetical protein Q8M07_09020 [Prosthecobacter sp.]|nr:hypothetical protein [Prosthecobacter sp.]
MKKPLLNKHAPLSQRVFATPVRKVFLSFVNKADVFCDKADRFISL